MIKQTSDNGAGIRADTGKENGYDQQGYLGTKSKRFSGFFLFLLRNIVSRTEQGRYIRYYNFL